MSTTTANLLRRIEAHLARTGMSESAFSHAVQKNGILLRRLRAGHGVHSKTVDRIEAIIGAVKPSPAPKKRKGK